MPFDQPTTLPRQSPEDALPLGNDWSGPDSSNLWVRTANKLGINLVRRTADVRHRP